MTLVEQDLCRAARKKAGAIKIIVQRRLTGAVLGGLLGEALRGVEALSSIAPLLSEMHPAFVLAPVVIDLFVVSVSFGLSFTPNIMSLVGVIVALVLFRRY